MNNFVTSRIQNRVGFILLDRPKALHSLSLNMIRSITRTLLDWKNDPAVHAVCIHASGERAFCAGGDIRFFYDVAAQHRRVTVRCWKIFLLKNMP